jgi:large subunit ribosomal protein L22
MAAVEDKVEIRARARWVRTAPRKAQLVADEIRGRSVPEAKVILAFMTRAAAGDVAKVLDSAVANAEANHGYLGDDLVVVGAEIGQGPTLKRWRARARGRVGRIKKRTCHITIRLAPVEDAVPRPPEETPKPSRRAKAETAPAVEEAPVAEAAEAAVAEPSAEEAPQEEAAVEPQAGETPTEEPEPESEPSRQRRKTAEPTTSSESAPAEAKLARPRSRAKTKPAAEETAPAEEAPKRPSRRRTPGEGETPTERPEEE